MVDTIPTSFEVLEMQAADCRCASLITLKLDDLILDERDPLSFLLHDLVHAYKMFSDDTLRKGIYLPSCSPSQEKTYRKYMRKANRSN